MIRLPTAATACLLALAATLAFGAPNEKEFKRLVDDAARAWADGDTQAAINLLEAARAIKPAGRVVFNLARAYEKLGDAENAIRHYEDYLGLPDTEATALRRARQSLTALYHEVTRPKAEPVAPVDGGAPPEPLVEVDEKAFLKSLALRLAGAESLTVGLAQLRVSDLYVAFAQPKATSGPSARSSRAPATT